MAKATRAQVARNGHVAALLRAEMAKRGLSVLSLAKAIGVDGSVTFVRCWVDGVTAPAPVYRAKLSKLFDLPVKAFAPKLLGDEDGQALVPVVERVRTLPAVRIGELLSVVFLANGTARFRMDSVVPTEQAMPILRILMDAGVVTARGDGDASC